SNLRRGRGHKNRIGIILNNVTETTQLNHFEIRQDNEVISSSGMTAPPQISTPEGSLTSHHDFWLWKTVELQDHAPYSPGGKQGHQGGRFLETDIDFSEKEQLIVLGLDVPRVGDLASIKGGFPSFHNPFGTGEGLYGTALAPLTLETFYIILPYAVILAAIGLIESLLTLNLVGEITGKRGGASQECMAQGAANVVTGFFGGMGGCAMIGQSMINVKSGGRTRIAGIAAALFLLSFIMFASPLIEQIPLAALVGVMFMVVIGTFAWNSLTILRRVPMTDAFVTILVTIVTVAYDLAIAVVVGVIVSALAYAWNNATRIHAVTRESTSDEGAKVYEIQGPLFFGSSDGFAEIFELESDPELVIVDFKDSRVVDQSALQAIEALAARYEAAGKQIRLRHLSRDCHKLLTKAGHLMVDSDDDPDYALAVDYDVQTGILDSGH
ncbi:SulP family inorganic anion transporter, partial [uncultured Lentibacter sp.]|uniref:SulP family inorganic anion transporter n=1 Tax=uncultured Lentibacter sp. TaxID=1659309 RepID=UPI0026347340